MCRPRLAPGPGKLFDGLDPYRGPVVARVSTGTSAGAAREAVEAGSMPRYGIR